MDKLIKEADDLHFKYSREELKTEQKGEKWVSSQFTTSRALIPQ